MASRWDTPWRHHDLSNPLLAAATLYGVESFASLFSHSGQIDAVAGAFALGAGARIWLHDQHFWHQVNLTVCTLFALAWIIYAEHTSPFTGTALTALGVALGFLGALYAATAFVDRRGKRKAEELQASLRRKAENGDWPALFASLGARDVELVSEKDFRAGHTLEFRLPAHGSKTFTHICTLTDRLEVALDLPRRSVKMREGTTARSFYVDIYTRNVFAENLPFEYEPTRTTINEPFDIGRDVFGEDIEVLIREIRAAIFAPPGSGKSNLLNVLIARLLRCVDVMIWVIDFKHRLVKPWLQPWIEGRTARPALDWVATTPREAQLMAKCLVKAIDHRSVTGVGSKITPSARQPAIILISDETASVVGLDAGPEARALAALLKDIIGRGRSEAVDALMAFLRPTVEMTGTSTFKALSKLRITLPGLTPADAASATDSPGLAAELAEIEESGAMLVNKGRGWARLGKSYLMEDRDVPVIAEAYSAWRPELEPNLEAELGEVYAKRWNLDRCGHLLPQDRQRELGYAPAAAAAEPEPQASRTTPNAAKPLPTIPPPPAGAKPAFQTVSGQPIPRNLDDAAVDELFADLREKLGDLKPPVHAGKERIVGLVQAAGDGGISPSELVRILNAERIECGRQAVQDWLRELVDDGTIVRRGKGDYIPTPDRGQ